MNETLRKCPFCGGEAVVRRGNVSKLYYVRCSNIECAVFPITDGFSTEGQAARAWNRRAERTCRIETGPSAVFKNETGPDRMTQDFVDRCSECGNVMNRDPFTGKYPRYCSWCGARVIEEDE